MGVTGAVVVPTEVPVPVRVVLLVLGAEERTVVAGAAVGAGAGAVVAGAGVERGDVRTPVRVVVAASTLAPPVPVASDEGDTLVAVAAASSGRPLLAQAVVTHTKAAAIPTRNAVRRTRFDVSHGCRWGSSGSDLSAGHAGASGEGVEGIERRG